MVRSCIVYLSFASVSQRLGIVILMIFQSSTLRRVYHIRNSQLVAVNAQRRINDTETSLLILLSDYGVRLWTFPFQRSFQFARIIYYWKKDGTMPSITQTDHARIIIPDLLAIYISENLTLRLLHFCTIWYVEFTVIILILREFEWRAAVIMSNLHRN